MFRRSALLLAFASSTACGPTGAVHTAYYGDLPTLKREIREAQLEGGLSSGRAVRIAEAVARREVRASSGKLAVAQVRTARGCTGAVVAELEERAGRMDEAGAEAMLVLLEGGRVRGEPLVARFEGAASGAWRAVAARSAVGERHGELRRSLMPDPDERVRRAALRAALSTRAPADLPELLEAARLDPDPLSRSLAARAAGAIGGERAVLGLKDLWAGADDVGRVPLVEAWDQAASRESGGLRALLWVTDRSDSLPAVVAAAALVRAGGDEEAPVGRGVLLRFLRHGSTQERRLALQLAPLDDVALEGAVVEASSAEDAQVRVIALARLLELPARREAARDALGVLATQQGSLARQARAALAAVGEPGVAKPLRRDLDARDPRLRRLAASGLVRLGDYPGAAGALADDDPLVRMAVACAILRAERGGSG